MKQAIYREGAGPLSMEVESGFAKPGFHEVFLWTADRQSSEKIGEGDFTSSTPVRIEPGAGLDGRIVQCIATVDLLGDPDLAVTLRVSQDDGVLASDTVQGPVSDPAGSPTVTLQIVVRLVRG